MQKNKNVTKYSGSSKKRLALTALVSLVGVLIILGVLELGVFTHLLHKGKPPAPVSGSSETKGETSSRSASAEKSNTTQNGENQKSDAAGDSSQATLLVPSGNFVSNHHPNLSGSPAPNMITSVCNTTPGAKCQIVFTKAGVTKSLPAQLIDGGGSTYWTNWKLQSYGLTSGSWKVSAIATLGDQTKTATDALALEVSP